MHCRRIWRVAIRELSKPWSALLSESPHFLRYSVIRCRSSMMPLNVGFSKAFSGETESAMKGSVSHYSSAFQAETTTEDATESSVSDAAKTIEGNSSAFLGISSFDGSAVKGTASDVAKTGEEDSPNFCGTSSMESTLQAAREEVVNDISRVSKLGACSVEEAVESDIAKVTEYNVDDSCKASSVESSSTDAIEEAVSDTIKATKKRKRPKARKDNTSDSSITCPAEPTVGSATKGPANHTSKPSKTKGSVIDPVKARENADADAVLALCEGKLWDIEVEKALSKIVSSLNHLLVSNVVRRMENDTAMHFFKWAGAQEGYHHEKHLYRLLFMKLVRAGDLESAVQVLRDTKDSGVTLSPKRLGTLFHYYGLSGKEVDPKIIKSLGLSSHPKLYSAALKANLKANALDRTQEVVQQVANDSDERKLESLNLAISTYLRAGKVDLALKVFEDMEKMGCSPNVETYNLIIRCNCKSKNLDEGLAFLAMMREEDLLPDIRSYNALIILCFEESRFDEVPKLVINMKEAGCCLDITTHSHLIDAYLRLGQVDKANEHVQNLMEEGSFPDSSRVRIICLCKVEELDKAKEVFQAAADSGETVPCDACNKLLVALCREGRLDDALNVFERMKSGVCYPDLSSYTIIIRCCCTLFELSKVKELLGDLKKRGWKVPGEMYVTVLHTLSRASARHDFEEVFEDLMRNSQTIACTKMATAVLDALTKLQELDKGLQLLDHVLSSDDLKIKPVQLMSFLQLLKKDGRGTEASDLLNSMLEKARVKGLVGAA